MISGYLFLSCLLPPITIKTGIDFLESWHGIATGNIRASGQEGESVLLKLSGKNFNDVCDSAAVIGKLFDGIFEKQSKCCCLLRINQLLHVAEIYILFSGKSSHHEKAGSLHPLTRKKCRKGKG